jgi:CrcB protein
LHNDNHDEVRVRVFWAVGVGAAAGGLARHYLATAIYARFGTGFPWATLLINISGSLLLGFIIQYTLGTSGVSREMRLLLTTGFCGGYTTFSTFSFDAAALMEEGRYERAALYVSGSVLLALAGTFAGFALARQLLGMRKGL